MTQKEIVDKVTCKDILEDEEGLLNLVFLNF